MLLDDLVFRIEYEKNDKWELGEDCFLFYKNKHLVDQYERFWSERKSFEAHHIFELGIWDGGSVAFWFEWFQPKKHVGVDISQKGNSNYFQRYVSTRGLEERIKIYWGINQADSEKLRQLAKEECFGSLDLVIDDASHMYEATKISFETLFPLLRPGGLYIIEDWGWEHWPEFQTPNHPWKTKISLTRLITELVEVTGTPILPTASPTALISNLLVLQGFVVVERGEMEASKLQNFKMEQYISRRPKESKLRRLLNKFCQ
jgi:SAM-dependent methyltransferase